MSIFKKLVTPVLSSILALAPLKSQALDGIIMNSITNQGIPNAIVKLYEGDNLLDSARTNRDGYYNLNTNSVAPEFNIPNNKSNEIKVFDINGRFLYILNNSWNGRTIPNLSSGTYIFASENKAIAMPVMEGNLINPIQNSLTERVMSGKSNNKTSNADAIYELSISDDGIEGEIGDFYDARLSIDVAERNDLNDLEKNVELIPFYDMQDWDGDFLEYLKGTQGRGVQIWGDYPEYYPVNVNLDSVSCARYMGDRTEETLNDIRNALDEWNQMTGLNIFNYEGNVRENDAQIRVDYSRNEGFPQFWPNPVRDNDGRWRYDTGIVYLRNNWISPFIIKHEFGHATGWSHESENDSSIMFGSNLGNANRVTEDDGYTVKTFTTLINNTLWDTYLPE